MPADDSPARREVALAFVDPGGAASGPPGFPRFRWQAMIMGIVRHFQGAMI